MFNFIPYMDHTILKINIPIYYGHLIIVISEDFKATRDELKVPMDDTELHYCNAFIFGRRNKNGVNEYLLVFKPTAPNSTIAHECFHFTNWLYRDRGVKADIDNDEPQAYLLGWAVGQVCDAFVKYEAKKLKDGR